MLRALISAALVLGISVAPEQTAVTSAVTKSSDRTVASDDQPSPNIDEAAEQQLLDMANRARARGGVSPLHLDLGMTTAARGHADVMVQRQQLSHQFEGELSLPQRLAEATSLHLDHAGENVALDTTVEQAHEHLMLSPPHRENLLDPGYNVAGFGVIRAGERLYVVEDFGHSLPPSTTPQMEAAIMDSVNHRRRQAGLPEFEWTPHSALRDAVCSMAHEDRLGTRSMRELAQRYTLLSYVNVHPEVLPANAARLIADRRFKNLAVGACYARSGTYPTGAYWVGLAFY